MADDDLDARRDAVAPAFGGSGTGGARELSYECAEWSAESRAMLAGLLRSQEIPHAWQGTTLTVRAADEPAVDALVDEVIAAATPALPPDAERIVYEAAEWPVSLQNQLADALFAAGIAFEWDEHGDLAVAVDDEEAVEGLIEELPDPDEVSADAPDGLDLHDLLGRLFVAADKLARRPADVSAVLEVAEVVPRVGAAPPPFGFESRQWRAIVEPATRLEELLSSEEGGDDGSGGKSSDEVAALAGDLRDLLRGYV